MMKSLPSSPSRSQALIEFEPILLDTFRTFTTNTSAEVRDAMHFALFSARDRFSTSAAWLIAPRLGISQKTFEKVACAIEIIDCSLAFKLKMIKARVKNQPQKFIDPMLAEAASYGLMPLAFEIMLGSSSVFTVTEQVKLSQILAEAASPAHFFSASRREDLVFTEILQSSLSLQELKNIYFEKVFPSFHAYGKALHFLVSDKNDERIIDWFKKLGLFSRWVKEFQSLGASPYHAEVLDLIKSLETELLNLSKPLGIQVVAHEIIEPIADILKPQLQ